MSRPLVISDCDEVLLYMVTHFKDWLEEGQGVTFDMIGNDFAGAMRWQKTGEVVEPTEVWGFLRGFFDTEMHRQKAIPGAVEGINALSQQADVVILTNLTDRHREMRAEQLANVGINARVFTNQGPKGPALKAIMDEYAPSRAVFIDDLAQHHKSAADTVPHLRRLHLCGEPTLAGRIACAHQAGDAHARIDAWDEALPWLLGELTDQATEEAEPA
ncbi:HAD family hydrolase [Altererythrobacter sp. TH136]|uniref:HAD family hydrolase n=1 Tax=Altererythrobacter sp. TH136 TaxID=2067415 RepID=UPI001165A98B|nr:HAD family hydrolase [Altererythrobacter sp. TH136]QDM40898.1 HAD family hydrolase [Altererythrobacter sp. TH136]